MKIDLKKLYTAYRETTQMYISEMPLSKKLPTNTPCIVSGSIFHYENGVLTKRLVKMKPMYIVDRIEPEYATNEYRQSSYRSGYCNIYLSENKVIDLPVDTTRANRLVHCRTNYFLLGKTCKVYQ
jgi:hypothetical protein